MDWFKEGVEAANRFDLNHSYHTKSIPRPECPWPIYTPEGIQWMRGWNSVYLLTRDSDSEIEDEEVLHMRPSEEGCRANIGQLFYPSDEELSIAESLV